MIRAALAVFGCLASPIWAQQAASTGTGAILRGLDKVSGNVTDIEISNGGTVDYGRLRITMTECRYPEGNLAGDAFAYLSITERGDSAPIFTGWMIASSPALNALDHSRYDVWVMRCRTS